MSDAHTYAAMASAPKSRSKVTRIACVPCRGRKSKVCYLDDIMFLSLKSLLDANVFHYFTSVMEHDQSANVVLLGDSLVNTMLTPKVGSHRSSG